MKKQLFISLINIICILVITGCAAAVRIDGPYEGRIIDADTREPIEGVVVLGVWYTEIPTVAGALHNFYNAMETVTDSAGNFTIKGLGLIVMSNVIPMDVLIFKAGYEYLGLTPWVGLKGRGWKGYEESYDPVRNVKTSKAVHDPRIKVTWEGDRAVIPLKMLTREEQRKQGLPNIHLEEKTEGGITHLYIPRNIKLIMKEIEKEEEALRPKIIRQPTGPIERGR